MIPVAIDILNVQKNINHICNSYINDCPAALKDYKEVGITERINSDPFVQLMKIEDPFSYIDLPNYKNQAAIPKYIINNSGDDFYSPDSSRFYFDQLKGDSNYIRYFPKSMHYYAGNPISDYLNNIKLLNDAVSNYFYFHINNMALPVVDWQKSVEKISVNSSLKPEKVTLWTAQNSAERDFRFLNSYSQFHFGKKIAWINLSKYFKFNAEVCDTCFKDSDISYQCQNDEICHIDANLPASNEGWQAAFLELFYNIDGREFVITTEVIITPDTYPDHSIQ
jgi:PhoPQ-activated pathogenicity-related protein